MGTTKTISLKDAKAWTKKWRDQHGKLTATNGKTELNFPWKAFLMPHNDLTGLLGESAVSVRFYFGIDDTNDLRVLIVGVDAKGNDMSNMIFDFTSPCPTICDKSSPLNS